MVQLSHPNRNHMRAKSPPLLGYSHHNESGALDHESGDAEANCYRTHYQQPQYSTFTSSSTAYSSLQCPQASDGTKCMTYGAALIPAARINYQPSSAPPSLLCRQCVACMSKLHQHEIKPSAPNQKLHQQPSPASLVVSVAWPFDGAPVVHA